MTEKKAYRKQVMHGVQLVLPLFAVLFFLPLVSATITVDSFSCNSQTATASVENGEAMNCNAVILNNDLQNAVAVNQVSLSVSGGWAEDDSYTVSLNTNIGAGQSKTVTFLNIRSTTPGADHRFLHIDIDGTAHTEEVDSLAVNAVALKSVSFSSSSSSVSTSGAFTTSSTVITGGSYSDVTLSISPSGCSLANNDVASKSIGSMGNNAQASRSWSLTMGTGTSCSITLTATGTAGPVISTKTKAVSVSNPTGSSGSSSSSSGGGGGGAGGNATNVTTQDQKASVPSPSPTQAPTTEATADEPTTEPKSSAAEILRAVTEQLSPLQLAVIVVAIIVLLAGLAFWMHRR